MSEFSNQESSQNHGAVDEVGPGGVVANPEDEAPPAPTIVGPGGAGLNIEELPDEVWGGLEGKPEVFCMYREGIYSPPEGTADDLVEESCVEYHAAANVL